MGKIIIVLAFIAIAYWYWLGPDKNSAEMFTADDPKKNAQIIADCVASGDYSETDNYKGPGESPEYICADQNNLYKKYGEWHRR